MAIIKKKIPALLQPDGQRMWTQRISPFNLHMTVNSNLLELRVKKLKGIKQFYFEKDHLSMGQYGNNIEMALLNPEKIDFFCTRLHICAKTQSDENRIIVDQLKQKVNTIVKLNRMIDKFIEEIKKDKGEVPLRLSQIQEEIKIGSQKSDQDQATVPD
jgi:hypothetical protein